MSQTPPIMAIKVKKKTKPHAKAKPKAKSSYDPLPTYTPSQGPVHYHFWLTNTNFNILPRHLFHPIIFSHLTQFPTNFTARYYTLVTEFPTKIPLGAKQSDVIDWSPCSLAKSAAIRKALGRIMRARFLFRKLLHHMRVRRLTVANLDDIVTVEPPKKLVELVDWKSKQKYRFEAATLMRDITCRLMTHDGFFEDPQEPRNPFTNIPFTQSQVISLWNSISEAGISVSVAFTAYRLARYDMVKFSLYNSILIKLNAHKQTMKDIKCFSYRERMLDFISFCYSEEILPFSTAAFTYCLIHYPSHNQIQRWAALCYKFYEVEILYSTDPETLRQKKDAILDSSIHLINSDKIIEYLYSVSNTIMEGQAIVDVFLLS
jgi:hypothetical protein